ncbi:CAAX protease self-immunity [Auraticoccus monumenti]|uniref:CAAX protease self-immunity n=1 Tax=Auraticoccus monumenti TaxID=675864 RepID=A0A1G7BHX3_9ACTN|nr:CAAX protease self-immunity [Auraticoccus monumenti]
MILLLLVATAVPVGIAVDRVIGVTPFDPANPSLTTGVWAVGNLFIALLVPVSTVLHAIIDGAAPGTLSSVAGRFRWVVLARAAVVVVPVWIVFTVLVQPALGTGSPRWTGLNLVLCVVAVITIPLQSAGEEYLFRGLLLRAVGALFARPVVAFVVATLTTALGFGLVHGASDPWAVAYYIVMGISFAVLAERTGGLEIPVLVHAANNTLLLVPVIMAGQLSTVSTPTGPVVLVPVVVMAVTTFVLWRSTPWLTRSTGSAVLTPAG